MKQQGRYDEAIEEFKRAVTLSPNDYDNLSGLAHAYALSGRRREAEDILRQLTELSKQRYVSAYDFALIYAALGRKDRALECLERAADEKAWLITHLKVEPRFDVLHSEQRFDELLRRVGLA